MIIRSKLIFISTFIISNFISTLSFGQSWIEFDKKGDLALQQNNIDIALENYLASAKLGTLASMNKAGAIYQNYKNNPYRALLWCSVAAKFSHASDFSCLETNEKNLTPQQKDEVKILVDQCIASNYKYCDQIDPLQLKTIELYYSTKCRVSDLTGTPLNIRTSPNGKILKTIQNGIHVTIVDTVKDPQGRDWSYLKSDESDMNLGWVFKQYLTCGINNKNISVQTATTSLPLPTPEIKVSRSFDIKPTSQNSPSNERIENAFDNNPNTKYLNFDKTHAGFIIHFKKDITILAIQITTANDYIGRDPTSISIDGSNDGEQWDSVTTTMIINLPDARKSKSQLFEIENTKSYPIYRFTFPTVKNMSRLCGLECDSVQIADFYIDYK